jgi:hypothetical protein
MRRPLVVRIDRLVLDEAVLGGLALQGRTRAVLQAALEAEIAARLAGAGLGHLAAGGARAALHAGELKLASGLDAAGLGRSLGTQIAGALQEEPKR